MQIKVEIHCHTNFSPCGFIKPERIEPFCLKKGVDVVAITDHNTIQGALLVKQLAEKVGVIVGEEIKTSHGEIIGYFLEQEIPSLMSPLDTVKAIKEQGGIVSVPHPFDEMRSSRLAPEALKSVIDKIDMIEVFNSRDILKKQDTAIIREALQHGVVAVSASDAHFAVEIGNSLTLIDQFKTPAEFLENLRKGQSIRLKSSSLIVHIATKLLKIIKKRKAGISDNITSPLL